METYLARLNCLSPYLTPWRNCTLWGRLSWIVADGRLPGWDIDTWADAYAECSPPLVVGDAFAADAVPTPALYLAAASGEQRRTKALPWDEWLKLCDTGEWPAATTRARERAAERTHVVMDRETGTAADGGLRNEAGEQPDAGLVIVAQAGDSLGEGGLRTLIGELCREGWGQGRSYGYGHVELHSLERMNRPAATGWAATLGHCHPTDDLPAEGFWRWTGVPVRPHDKATRRGPRQLFTTMLLPGASFPIESDGPVGRVIGWAERSDYQHYGLAPTWPVRAAELLK